MASLPQSPTSLNVAPLRSVAKPLSAVATLVERIAAMSDDELLAVAQGKHFHFDFAAETCATPEERAESEERTRAAAWAERDRRAAERRRAQREEQTDVLAAAIVRALPRVPAPTASSHVPIPIDRALYDRWRAALPRAVGKKFWRIRRTHVDRIARFLPTTGDVLDPVKLAQWKAMSLQEIGRRYFKAMCSTLKSLGEWLETLGIDFVTPPMPKPGKKDKGVRASTRKQTPTPISPDELERLVDAAPIVTKTGKPLRLALCVQWDTSLRPSTVEALRIPEHYNPARPTKLNITADIDKEGYARELDLTERLQVAFAKRAKDLAHEIERARRAGQKEGVLIIGPYQASAKKTLPKLARRIGIDETRAEKFTVYDIRHAAGRHITDLAGQRAAAYLLGHKNMSETDRYTAPDAAAGARAVAALSSRTGSLVGVVSTPNGSLAQDQRTLC